MLTVTNTNTLSLLSILNRTQSQQSNVLTQLSTGLRINKGSDDPAGLIALRSLETELAGVNAAIDGTQRTDAMLGVADNALGEIASQIEQIATLAASSANSGGLSAAEISANQSQIDNAIDAIDRIARTTEFNGKRLLDGSLGVGVTKGGTNPTNFNNVQVFSRSSGSSNEALTVAKTADAAQADLVIFNAANDTTATGAAGSFSITGEKGTAVIDVLATDTAVELRAKINAVTSETGITADNGGTANSGDVELSSQSYGSNISVRATNIDGNIATAGTASGTDATVTVNGTAVAVDGTRVFYNSNGTNVAFDVTATGGAHSATITLLGDTGATFQLGTDSSTRTTIGIDGVYASQLGSSALGFLNDLKSGGASDLLTDPNKASQIADAAATSVAEIQGRLGGFQKFQVNAALNQMNAVKEGLTSAKSVIGDVDFAEASSELNRQNVLLQSAISLLGLANQQSAQVLSLLR